MARYEAVNTYSMSRRISPNVDNTPLGSIPAQSKIHGDVLNGASGSGECWLEIKDINGVASTGWVAIEHTGRVYCSLTEINPPSPVPVVTLTHNIEVYSDGSIRIDAKPIA